MRKLLTPKTIFFFLLGSLLISFSLLLNAALIKDGVERSDCTQSIKPELLWEPISQQFITSISPY